MDKPTQTTTITITVTADRAEEYIEHVVLPDLRNGNLAGYTDVNNQWTSEGLWEE